jgi:hypothetical protein
MGNHDATTRRNGKDKQKDTFNKYGKNTTRGVRIALAALQTQHRNEQIKVLKGEECILCK